MIPQHLDWEKPKYFIRQYFTACLSQIGYYIESISDVTKQAEAVIIDPMRDSDYYIELAKERGATIKCIIETHFHADFISGHIDLSKKTLSKICYGPGAQANYTIYNFKNNELMPLGQINLQILHTPGHTLESISIAIVVDKIQHAVFTGDALFVNEVGRPDLAVTKTVTKYDLAYKLFDSLRGTLMVLPDQCLVFPAHGKGSQCGKKIEASQTFSTIIEQKLNNYALQDMTKEKFMQIVLEGMDSPPKYFMNRGGNYSELDIVMNRSITELTIDQFLHYAQQNNTQILDTRPYEEFMNEFIAGSLNISLKINFAVFVGNLIQPEKNILLITQKNQHQEVILRLARIGYEGVLGYLPSGIDEWKKNGYPLDKYHSITVQQFNMLIQQKKKSAEKIFIMDCRKPSERTEFGEVIDTNTDCIPEQIQTKLKQNQKYIPKTEDIYTYCKSGGRASLMICLLKRLGYNNVINVIGGFDKIKEICPEIIRPVQQ